MNTQTNLIARNKTNDRPIQNFIQKVGVQPPVSIICSIVVQLVVSFSLGFQTAMGPQLVTKQALNGFIHGRINYFVISIGFR